MNLTFERSGEPLSNDDIVAVEVELGVALPAQYRTFLAQHNGGNPSLSVFKYLITLFEPHHGSSSAVNQFYGVTDSGDLLDLRRRRVIAAGRIPTPLLPIAFDIFGNTICIGVEGKWLGKVYLWHHEFDSKPEPKAQSSFENVFPVADDFNTFLESLRPMEDYETDD